MLPHLSPLQGRLAALALLALPLSACMADKSVTGSTYPRDYRERHPIVLKDAPRSLDVFTAGAALDDRQRDDVRAFAAEYLRSGNGPITAQIPAGSPGAHRTFQAVRAALAEGGLPGTAIAVSSYQPADPVLASPIRLSYAGMRAQVASKCGLWPQDLGVTDVAFNIRNEPYWNLGCSMQNNVAAQVADPVDLVRGRSEGRPDTIRRAKVIESIRQGKDPSTQYRQDGQNRINSTVAN
ncbi:CpaD family pilus assembly protein [Salinarimonas soli]|uniref:Pilus assembly protein CpaD n=1 Tax=Salinarimonas soli TaxID=1638099 RepID=A0A5B2V855_9HYPH|nr:CpaD family pilus assembly protein [Salinarimonas soli]KAA2234996.1 pilus assembly protein CpaD [Salinarimonas soli]